MSIKDFKDLTRALHGDLLAMGRLADTVSGKHMAEFFRTSQERLDAAIETNVRDASLELAKQVEYNTTQLFVVREILTRVQEDDEAQEALVRAWKQSEDDPPDLRDAVVGATLIAPAYASTTGPIRRLYIDALRGSYAPPIYTFGFGPELLRALIRGQLVPGDIDLLAGLAERGDRSINLLTSTPEIDGYERLASGDFIEMFRQNPGGRGGVHFIRHRTEATDNSITVRITMKGQRLFAMIAAGRGERKR